MLVIVVICDRIELLPYFLRYYLRLGASRFVCPLWNGEKNPLAWRIKALAACYDFTIRPSVICPYEQFNGPVEAPGVDLVRQEFAQDGEWYCVADLDEFYAFPFQGSLGAMAEAAQARGYDAVHGVFHDRVSQDGQLVPVSGTLDTTFPLECDLSRCGGVTTSKIALARSEIQIRSGHHGAVGKVWHNAAEVHHFKWVQGIKEQLEARSTHFTAQGLPWAGESGKFLRMIEHGIDLTNPDYRVRAARLLGI